MEPYTVSSNRPLRKVVSQGTLIEEPSRQESEADVVDVIETEQEEPAGEPTKEKVKKEKIVAYDVSSLFHLLLSLLFN